MTSLLPQHPLVVRRPEVQAYRDAASILADARQDSTTLRETERQKGYDDGFRSGQAAAAKLLGDLGKAVETYWLEREQELVPLALALAHKILSSLPPHDVLAGVARAAIAEHRRDASLILRASPEAAAALKQCLAQDRGAGHVAVLADPDLLEGSCVLLHDRGRTDIGLLDQFRAVLSALKEQP